MGDFFLYDNGTFHKLVNDENGNSSCGICSLRKRFFTQKVLLCVFGDYRCHYELSELKFIIE